MSRESKILNVNPSDAQQQIYNYECFGWELLSVSGNLVSMSRETQNPVYKKLVNYEHNFELLMTQRDSLNLPAKPKPVNGLLAFLLFLMLIIPLIIYLAMKTNQKKKYDNAIKAHQGEYQRLTNEMDYVCKNSRAIFFSKQ